MTASNMSTGQAKKRWTVSLDVSCDDIEIEADSQAEAERKASEQVEGSSYNYNLCVTSAYATEIKYERPPGTDRWAPVADEIRFAEDAHRWLAGDDCWWWTNGHVAVRCEGAVPANVGRKVGNAIEKVVGDHKRDRISWAAPNDRGLMVAKTDKRVQAKADYVRLVESGCPGVEWLAVEGDHDEPWTVPITAVFGGELVAVLMGVRP